MEKTSNKTDAPKVAPESSKEISSLGKILQWAIYPLSAISGLYVTYINVSNSAYDNVKWTGALDSEKETYIKTMKNVGSRANYELNSGKEFNFPEATRPIVKVHEENILASMKRLKVDSFVKKWGINGLYQRQNAVLAGMTAAGIGVAIGAMITDSKFFKNFFSEKSTQQER